VVVEVEDMQVKLEGQELEVQELVEMVEMVALVETEQQIQEVGVVELLIHKMEVLEVAE
jgi:hypothetical protein